MIKSFSDRENVIATILGEARGEKDKKGSSYEAMQAVANVIDNRSKRKQWKKLISFTDIVKQKKQFEVWKISSDPKKNKDIEANRADILSIMRNKNTSEYKDAVKITDLLLAGNLKDITNGADHFYRHNIKKKPPSWSYKMSEVKRVFNHRFLDSEKKQGVPWTVPEETPFITPKIVTSTPLE